MSHHRIVLSRALAILFAWSLTACAAEIDEASAEPDPSTVSSGVSSNQGATLWEAHESNLDESGSEEEAIEDTLYDVASALQVEDARDGVDDLNLQPYQNRQAAAQAVAADYASNSEGSAPVYFSGNVRQNAFQAGSTASSDSVDFNSQCVENAVESVVDLIVLISNALELAGVPPIFSNTAFRQALSRHLFTDLIPLANDIIEAARHWNDGEGRLLLVASIIEDVFSILSISEVVGAFVEAGSEVFEAQRTGKWDLVRSVLWFFRAVVGLVWPGASDLQAGIHAVQSLVSLTQHAPAALTACREAVDANGHLDSNLLDGTTYGGSGGSSYRLECGDDEALVGFDGGTGKGRRGRGSTRVHGLRPICATAYPDFTQRSGHSLSYPLVAGSTSELDWVGGNGSDPFELRCSDDEFVVGIRGRSGSEVDKFGIICAHYRVLQDGDGRWTTFPLDSLPDDQYGGGGGSAFSYRCPGEARLGRGLAGRAGSRMDRVQLLCGDLGLN